MNLTFLGSIGHPGLSEIGTGSDYHQLQWDDGIDNPLEGT